MYDRFLIDSDDLPAGYKPIKFDSTYNQIYFPVDLSKDNQSITHKFYFNHSPDIHSDYIKYDYFGSGELYLNLSFYQPQSITGIHYSAFLIWYTQVVASTKIFDKDSLLNYYEDEQSSMNVFMIKVSEIFNIIASPTETVETPQFAAICKSFTLSNDNVDIKSSDYLFANIITDFSSCSHETFKNRHVNCSFVGNFESCPMFTPKVEYIKTVSITKDNTTSSVNYSLRTHQSMNDDVVLYEIYDETNLNTIHRFQVNLTDNVSKEDAQNHALEVFQESIDVYQNDNLEEVNFSSNDPKLKTSFIASLV